jgi:hypothetical protein
MEISRWCEPPVLSAKCDKPRQGQRSGVAGFPPPLPGLVFCLQQTGGLHTG